MQKPILEFNPFFIIQLPVYKKLLSYFYPLSIRRVEGDDNEYLELLLHRNQFQLVTADAMYSDGDRYLPAIYAINDLKRTMSGVSNVLVLGTGLASLVRVVRAKGYDPNFTLVDLDSTVLKWAMELMEPTSARKITPVCSDAGAFLESCTTTFDLIFVDVFNGRVVPEFVTTMQFLSACKARLTKEGRVVVNYIVNDEHEWEKVQRVFGSVFPGHHVLTKGINRIMITPNPSGLR